MKLKTKIVLLVAFLLITLGLFNVAYAAETTSEELDVDEIVALLPDTISVDIKEIDYQDVEDEIIKEVEEILIEEGISLEDFSVADAWLISGDIHRGMIDIKNNNKGYSEGKAITVEYSNTSEYNAEYESIVEDYTDQITSTIYCYYQDGNEIRAKGKEYIFDECIAEQYPFPTGIEAKADKLIGDVYTYLSDGWDAYVYVFYNDVCYSYITCRYRVTYAITIPADVEDTTEAYIEYAEPYIYDALLNGTYGRSFATEEQLESLEIWSDDGHIFYVNFDRDSTDEYFDVVALIKEEGTAQEDTDVTVPEDSGVVISSEEIESTESTYKELEEKLAEDGYDDILVAFEVKLISGDISNGIEISFNVGTENNGKKAIILHKKSDGTYETANDTVVDGIVKMTVTELSPFMIALVDTTTTTTENDTKTTTTTETSTTTTETSTTTTTDTTKTTTEELDETPKTGANEISAQISMLVALISIASLAIIKRNH